MYARKYSFADHDLHDLDSTNMNSPEMLNGCEQLVEMEQCRTSMRSAEGGGSLMSKSPTVKVLVDIEHANVEDDPRQWSKTRKVRVVLTSDILDIDDKTLINCLD